VECPRCRAALRERERETATGEVIVMDVCPACGGVWLDAGELEKLTQSENRYYAARGRDRDDRRRNRNEDDDDDDGGGIGGFLGNLFGRFGD
jgi:Zn-finger nucleic acid-binding protein